MGGIMHGQTLQRYHIAYKSGLYFDAREIVSQAYGLGMEAPVFSEDGTKLYFKNSPYDDYKQMELNSMHIYPIDETEYERAASRIVRSGFNMVINGISTPMYSIGGRDYIRADDLTSCGFTVNESDKTLAVSYSNKAQLGKEPDAISVSGNARKLTELSLVINGEYSDFSNGNPIYTYNDSLFIPLSEIEYDYPYEDTGSSMTYRYDIYAGKAYMSF
jgi:hypothetical protein